jgi:hypothetical protein
MVRSSHHKRDNVGERPMSDCMAIKPTCVPTGSCKNDVSRSGKNRTVCVPMTRTSKTGLLSYFESHDRSL